LAGFPIFVLTHSHLRCSSDTWVIEKGFSCFNLTGSPESEATCNFGPVFNRKSSKTFKPYPKHVFNIEYADLEYLYGTVAFETVSAGGLAVCLHCACCANHD